MKIRYKIPVIDILKKDEFYSLLKKELRGINFEADMKDGKLYFTRKIRNTNNPTTYKLELFKFLRKGFVALIIKKESCYIELYINQNFIVKTSTLLALVFFIDLKYISDLSYFHSIVCCSIFFSVYYILGHLFAFLQIREKIMDVLFLTI